MDRLPAGLAGSAAHVFVTDLDRPVLSENDIHHLLRSLRLRAGEVVTASDGDSAWRSFTLQVAPGDDLDARARGRSGALGEVDDHSVGRRSVGRNGPQAPAVLQPAGEVHRVAANACTVGIGFSLTTAAAAREVTMRLTEIGVDEVVPVVADRSASAWRAERLRSLVDGLRRVAREASMQSRRIRIPTVADAVTTGELADLWRGTAWMADFGGGEDVAGTWEDRKVLRAMVGPEGGWSQGEIALGLPRVGLGPTVLRAETAAFVAATLLRAAALRAG